MDFGIFYEIQVDSPLKHREREYQAFHDVMNQVVRAEEVGFTNFWTVEHHFQVGFAHCSAPEVLYGAISQRTSKIRIGHAVVLLPFPYNHPVRIAERVATLDILSNGRVEVGTGRSITQVELGGFGIPYKETRARWEEALDIITTIWKSKDGTFSYKGKYFDIPQRTVVPMPIQKPHPPMWVACTSEDTHELAGKLGLGLLSFTLLVSPEQLGQRVRAYRNAIKTAKPYGAFVEQPSGRVLDDASCGHRQAGARRGRARIHVLRRHDTARQCDGAGSQEDRRRSEDPARGASCRNCPRNMRASIRAR